MVTPDKETEEVLLLYQRSRQWGALPDPGGIFSQEESLMQAFDVIGEEIEEHRRGREREAQMKQMHDDAERRFRAH